MKAKQEKTKKVTVKIIVNVKSFIVRVKWGAIEYGKNNQWNHEPDMIAIKVRDTIANIACLCSSLIFTREGW